MSTRTALFVNGVYEGVFTEIMERGGKAGTGEAFLQPHAGKVIRMLQKRPPTREAPTKLFASTTRHLSLVSYAAEIIRWEDKRELPDGRRREVVAYLEKYQPGELGLFHGTANGIGDKPVNLLTISELKRLDTHFPTSCLRKVSDDRPLKHRSRAGGWS